MLVPINPIPTTPAMPGSSIVRVLSTLPFCATRLPALGTTSLRMDHNSRLHRAQATSGHLDSFLERLFDLQQGQVNVTLSVGCGNRTLLGGNWKDKDAVLDK